MKYQRNERDNAGWTEPTPPRYRSPLIFFVLLVVLSLLVGVALGAVAIYRGRATYADFMRGCEQDHKHYECMLLWRASGRGRDNAPVVPTNDSVHFSK